MAATAEKQTKEDLPQDDDDDYYSDSASNSDFDYDSYSEDDIDEPQTESDHKAQNQRRRRPQQGTAVKGRDNRSFDYYDESEDESQAVAPFERLGGDEASMDGPVTRARQERGEIPERGGNQGGEKFQMAEDSKKSIDDEEGLKLKLELNLDIEVELKASIHGDLTLALLA
ncbi:hypothetical protein BGW36DRAFT_405712 [Talaromyces proteolyticus]|uniref:Uncharacterized protein n=1 Tax=Talaromyces proteolyticus TaxID=1131652 RepID=A0AAD4PXW0_9EURO|nr:uncharacterized protein BGW36DRAFT_405712 [Talaromyces proteolyticus]KAH8700475.1 hypothetical protein BGW36DRAFT_405712 [Talaromyces proteolyticus]